jgi:hypothetical protein
MTAHNWSSPGTEHCAVCGQSCIFVSASGDPDEAPSKFGGWYCSPCDAFTETDVEVED